MKKMLGRTGIFLLVLFFTVSAHAANFTIVCDEWPPYQIVENGNVTGFSTDIVRAVLKQTDAGIKSLNAYPWKRAISMIKSNRADALFSANYKEERTKFAYFPAEPLIESPWVVWVRAEDDITFNNFEDLKGQFGLVRGYSYTPEFWAYLNSESNFELAAKDETNFKKLNAGRIKYTVAELGNGYELIKSLKLKNIIPLTAKPIKSDGLFIMFNKTSVSKGFVDKFSKALKEFKKSPDYKAIHNKYFSAK